MICYQDTSCLMPVSMVHWHIPITPPDIFFFLMVSIFLSVVSLRKAFIGYFLLLGIITQVLDVPQYLSRAQTKSFFFLFLPIDFKQTGRKISKPKIVVCYIILTSLAGSCSVDKLGRNMNLLLLQCLILGAKQQVHIFINLFQCYGHIRECQLIFFDKTQQNIGTNYFKQMGGFVCLFVLLCF